MKTYKIIVILSAIHRTMKSEDVAKMQMIMRNWETTRRFLAEHLPNDSEAASNMLMRMLAVEVFGIRKREYVIKQLHSRMSAFLKKSGLREILEAIKPAPVKSAKARKRNQRQLREAKPTVNIGREIATHVRLSQREPE